MYITGTAWTTCVVCHHMDIQYRYMPQDYRNIYETALKSNEANVNNPLCLTNVLRPMMCEFPLYPAVQESRCLYRRVTMHLKDMIGHLPRKIFFSIFSYTIQWNSSVTVLDQICLNCGVALIVEIYFQLKTGSIHMPVSLVLNPFDIHMYIWGYSVLQPLHFRTVEIRKNCELSSQYLFIFNYFKL